MFILANIIQEAFSPLISVFQSILVFIHTNITTTSWGLAIVGLTVLIRAVLVPLTLKQFRSMQELQRLAPELKALQEKYKDDKQRQQQEIMGFYKEHKVNPFASCLPLLLQLPVFISLFYMLRTDLKKNICGPALVSHYNSLHHTAVSTFSGLPTKYVEQTGCQKRGSRLGQILVHTGHHLQGDRCGPDRAAGALCRLSACLDDDDVGDGRPDTAAPDDGPAAVLRDHPLQVPCRPAGVLDNDQPVDGWPGLFVRRSFGPPPVSVAKGVSPPGTSKAISNGKAEDSRASKGEPALAGAGVGSAPPPPPRKKKKRSGRRR